MNTLGRSTNLKEGRCKPRSKAKNTIESEKASDTLKAVSPTFSEPLNEFSPSEDEGANVDENIPPPVSFCYHISYKKGVDKNHCSFI